MQTRTWSTNLGAQITTVVAAEKSSLVYAAGFFLVAKLKFPKGNQLASVAVDGSVWRIALSPDELLLFAGLNTKGNVLKIDTKNMIVVG